MALTPEPKIESVDGLLNPEEHVVIRPSGLRGPFRRIGLATPYRRLTGTRSMKIRLLSEKNIRSVAPTLPEIVALVEQAYRLDAEGKAEVPTKIGVHPERANTFLHAMPAWVGGARALGMKWVSYFPGNSDRGLPDSTGIIILNDPDHGLPCCIMEGMYVTFLRTAACAAVAAKYLAPRPPKTLGLIGCGGLGLWSLRTMTATFPSIEQVFVSSRTRRSREEFCAKMTQEGNWTITPVEDPLQAVRNMDIVVTSIPPARRQAGDGRSPHAGHSAHSARPGELVAGRRAARGRSGGRRQP